MKVNSNKFKGENSQETSSQLHASISTVKIAKKLLVKVKKSHGQAIKNNNWRIFNYDVMHGGKVNSKKRVYMIKGFKKIGKFEISCKFFECVCVKTFHCVSDKMLTPRTIYYSSFACCLSIFKHLAISIFPFFF